MAYIGYIWGPVRATLWPRVPDGRHFGQPRLYVGCPRTTQQRHSHQKQELVGGGWRFSGGKPPFYASYRLFIWGPMRETVWPRVLNGRHFGQPRLSVAYPVKSIRHPVGGGGRCVLINIHEYSSSMLPFTLLLPFNKWLPAKRVSSAPENLVNLFGKNGNVNA